jgi:hypothetical protein
MLKRGVVFPELMLEPQAKNIAELEGIGGLANERKPPDSEDNEGF